jgi:hypothetical protein
MISVVQVQTGTAGNSFGAVGAAGELLGPGRQRASGARKRVGRRTHADAAIEQGGTVCRILSRARLSNPDTSRFKWLTKYSRDAPGAFAAHMLAVGEHEALTALP